jgi:hypothetical protein
MIFPDSSNSTDKKVNVCWHRSTTLNWKAQQFLLRRIRSKNGKELFDKPSPYHRSGTKEASVKSVLETERAINAEERKCCHGHDLLFSPVREAKDELDRVVLEAQAQLEVAKQKAVVSYIFT